MKVLHETLDRVPFIIARYFCHFSVDGQIISRPLNVLNTFRYMFKRSMRLGNRNVVVSCSFAFAAWITQFLSWYNYQHVFIIFIIWCHMLIDIASATLKEAEEIVSSLWGV